MKWTLNINQQQAVALGLRNPTEAIILGMICDCHSWAEPQIVGDSVYYWTARQEFVRQLPLLDLKVDTVYRYLRNLEKLGLIEYRKLGKKDCVRLTNTGKTYYVGKKSGLAENPEKNPSESGKKSEKNSEKYPTDSSIISYSSINDSSSSSSTPPQIEDEEEGTVSRVVSSGIVPTLSLPPQIEHIPESVVLDWLKQKSERSDVVTPVRYRAALLKKLKNQDPETLENILMHAESGDRQVRSPAERRAIGGLVLELTNYVEILSSSGISNETIVLEVEKRIREALLAGRIDETDIPKIQQDLTIAMGGIR